MELRARGKCACISALFAAGNLRSEVQTEVICHVLAGRLWASAFHLSVFLLFFVIKIWKMCIQTFPFLDEDKTL